MSIYGVIKFQAPFERLKEYDYSPEVRLYKAILTQAMIDASNVSDSPEAKKYEIEAKTWIFGNSAYFQEVCHNAEINPDFMIQITKEAIKLNSRKRGRSQTTVREKRKQNFKQRYERVA
jgi:hypothetical protein